MVIAARNRGHAYIFEGDAGEAVAFAKALNCLTERDVACNGCISCRVFDSGNHPDTHYIVNTNTKTKTNDIGVEDVRRQIVAEMATAPSHYRYKVFIIGKAETLTPAAQNALLKTIEEPASYGVFLLQTAKTEALLETVRSRCVTVKTAFLPMTESGQNADIRQEIREIADNAHTRDILGALALYKKFEPFKDSKESAATALDMLYTEYGVRLRTTGDPCILRALKAITRAKEALSHNGNFQLAIEMMLLQIGGHVA
jgi:DNA polymerase III gamma/tau subunit